MAAAIYIVVEGDDPGYDIFVHGRALARHEDALGHLAGQLRVRPLLDFFSADVNAMALLAEREAGMEEWGDCVPRPQWFSPADGLETVRALIGFLADHPAALGSETRPVQLELAEFEQVLSKTLLRSLRWHLAVSFL
jgi:hypothetical protein